MKRFKEFYNIWMILRNVYIFKNKNVKFVNINNIFKNFIIKKFFILIIIKNNIKKITNLVNILISFINSYSSVIAVFDIIFIARNSFIFSILTLI